MIDIKDISGKILLSVPITESCEHVEELMQSDHIVLSWNSDKSDILPMGAYIEYGGEKYSLLEPYSPIQKSEEEFSYQPLFKSVVMYWAKVSFFMYTYSSDDVIIGREPDWTLTDNPANFMSSICKAIKNETGETWTYTVDASLSASATLSFQSVDIYSSLNSIANAFETEWWIDKANKVIHLSKAEHGIAVRLEVGKNITVPTVTVGKEGYYTRFYAFGSTRNIVQDYEGANVNNLVNKRLTLDPVKYPNGYKDIRPDLKQGEIFQKILIFDNVYPSSSLEISDVRVRLMWTIGEDGEKVQVGTDNEGNPIYDQYSIWYFKVPGFVLNNTIYSKDNPEGMLISGKALSVHFESGALQGREFELIYHDKAETVSSADGTSVILTPGDYEIKFKEEGTYIIPAITSLIPNNGDEIILFNIRMPEEYTGSAYLELESEMNKEISRLSSDLNNYQFSSNPISFSENNPDLSIGRKITYVNGGYSVSTRVIKLVTKIDFKYIQSITVGNEKIKGNTQELKEEVISANKDINLLSVLNDMTTSLTQSYNRTQQMMLDGFAAIKNIWQFKEDESGAKYAYSKFPVVTAYGVTMYAGAYVQVPSIYEGLPIDGVTIQWVDGKLVATGGKGTANGIVVNGNTYTPNEDGIITLPNYPTSLEWGNISGKPSWIGSTKPSYSWDEIGGKPSVFPTNWENVSDKPSWIGATKPTYDFSEIQNKPTTIAGYGITDAYTKNDISGLLSDYVTKSGAQDITGIKSFINGLNIGDILVKKHSDGVVELDGDLILTGSLTMFAQGSHTASTILDALPIDNTTLSKEGGVLSVIGGVGGGSVDGIILNGTTYSPDETTKLITLPNYPTTLPASDVYSWAKQPNKPSYSFGELSSHPTTLSGYGITDAVTIDTHQQIYGSKEFRQTVFIDTQSDVKLIMRDDDNHALIGAANSKGSVLSRLGYYGDRWGIDGYKILTTNNYSAELDNRYVNKAGDTMTGKLLFNADSGIDLISIPRTKSAISFNNAGSNRIGINYTDGDGNLRIAKTDINQDWVSGDVNILLGSNNYKVLHTGNYAGVLDSRYFRHIGDTYEDGRNTGWIGFGTGTYINAYPDGIAHKIYSYGQVTSFNSSYSRLELYSTHTSSDPNDGNNGIQFRSGWNDDKKSWRMLLDEVNYLHYTDNRYVNKIGDAMTGNLVFAHTSERPSYSGSIGITFREQIANGQGVKLVYNDYDNYRAPAGLILVGEQGGEYFEAPAIYQNGYKVWDAGNKRDMFSSMNEAFTAWGNEQVINVEGDANTYYPVAITIDGTKTWNSRISIYKNLGSRTPSYPGNHDNGTSSMWAMYEGRYNGWDGNGGYIVTKYVRQPYANLISKAEHAGNNAGKLVVYLRGGGCEYRVCTDYRAGVSVYYERTEISGYIDYPVYVEPTTSVGNQGVLNLVSYDYLVQKAVRLETPRSLWGQTFDGTGNVNGTIHVNSGGIYPIILRNSGGSECSIDYQCSGEHFVAGVYPDRFFIWRENGGEIASFLSNGNVGIGSLSTSGKKLYVNGDVGVAGTIYLETLSGGNERDLLYQQIADNDLFRIRCGGPSNQGWVEIATADDGTEPIYVRQYTGKFASITRTLTLLDGSGNTICPGNLLTYGGITMYSDLRKKNVLNSIIVPLDVMANADLFDYTFKTDEKCKVRAGTSAQYWNVFLPQVTDTDNEGFFTMSYDVLATTCVLSMAKHFQRFLIEDFNNHETRIEFLERENKELKDSNKEMMNRIIELERRAA